MKGTRKQKKQALTIPQLRKAFDYIETFTQSLISRVKDTNQRRKAFQEEWQKVFKRAVDDKAADAYILFESKKGKSKTLKKMKGGAAPLDYSTGPGLFGVYGIFPQYITQGFVTEGNATNNMAIQATCNGPNAFQPPYTGFGAASLAQSGGKRSRRHRKEGKRNTRKYKGGGFLDNVSSFAQSLSLRPVTANVPPSALHDAQMMWKGAPVASPQPYANTANPPYMPYTPGTISTTAGNINRDLNSEIQTL